MQISKDVMHKFAKAELNAMWRYAVCKYDLRFVSGRDVPLRSRIRDTYRGRSSWGGSTQTHKDGYCGSVDLLVTSYRHVDGDNRTMFTEYKAFNDHPVIGKLDNPHWQQAILALIAHEIAHAIIHITSALGKSEWAEDTARASFAHVANEAFNPAATGKLTGHDAPWQVIYADLRQRFVNGDAFQPIDVKIRQKRKVSRNFYTRSGGTKTVKGIQGRISVHYRASDNKCIGYTVSWYYPRHSQLNYADAFDAERNHLGKFGDAKAAKAFLIKNTWS